MINIGPAADAAENGWRLWFKSYLAAEGHEMRLPVQQPVRCVAPRARTPKSGLQRELAETVEQALEMVLNIPSSVDDRRLRRLGLTGKADLMECDFHFIGDIIDKMEGGGRYYFSPEVGHEAENVFWPIDFAIAVKKATGEMFIHRISSTLGTDLRHRPQQRLPEKIMWIAWAKKEPQRPWWSERSPIGLINGRWFPLDAGDSYRTMGRSYDAKFLTELNDTVGMAFSARLSARYDWHVAFGRPEEADGSRLVLPTNPRGALELFRSRRKTGDRRTALRHWVNEHYRRRSATADLEYVCEHLRGESRFMWHDLACELMVSEYDLEKNAWFRARAGEWRAMRKHNRPMLRVRSVRKRAR